MEKTPFIDIREIRKSFDGGKSMAVDCLSLAVYKGQTVGLIGADGAGKSTLLRLLAGLLLPDGGSIRVTIDYDDGRITDYPYIAMEPQVLQLMAESFTVDEHATTSAESQPPLATEAKAPAAPSAPSETEVLEARKLAL